MFEIIKSVISAGGYKLADIQHKIKKLYILGDLAEDEMNELLVLASGGASIDAERPETLQLILSLAAEMEVLRNRVKALEGSGDELPEHPEWKPWDGIGKDYQKGTIVSHNGKLWESIYDGQNVWEPDTPGTEGMWRAVSI